MHASEFSGGGIRPGMSRGIVLSREVGSREDVGLALLSMPECIVRVAKSIPFRLKRQLSTTVNTSSNPSPAQ